MVPVASLLAQEPASQKQLALVRLPQELLPQGLQLVPEPQLVQALQPVQLLLG
jgi:hypothetical protein